MGSTPPRCEVNKPAFETAPVKSGHTPALVSNKPRGQLGLPRSCHPKSLGQEGNHAYVSGGDPPEEKLGENSAFPVSLYGRRSSK
jgi:hypothetical protein